MFIFFIFICGIGFDVICFFVVFIYDIDVFVFVIGFDFINDGNDRNVIFWFDYCFLVEVEVINVIGYLFLKYVGGKMLVEMEILKVLWLKNNMFEELWERCKFYDLVDVLMYIVMGEEIRSFCSVVCK